MIDCGKQRRAWFAQRHHAGLAGWTLLTVLAFGGTLRADTGDVTGTVAGVVTVPAGQKRPTMVVYLEPVDGSRRFPAPAEPAIISQKGAKFSPALLLVSVGQTVDFRNDEDRPIEHNVFSRSSANAFDLGLYPPGVGKRVTFDEPGAVHLYCSIHRYMDGVIYVCPTPFFAEVSEDGGYEIKDVPPGAYKVTTWQRQRRYREQTATVTVGPGETTVVDFAMNRK